MSGELDLVREAAEARKRADAAYRHALQQARDAGFAASRIAAASGVTRQAVLKTTRPPTKDRGESCKPASSAALPAATTTVALSTRRAARTSCADPTREATLTNGPPCSPTEEQLRQRLEVIDERWDRFVDAIAPAFTAKDKGETSYRNVENARARRQASGLTRGGKPSGACGRASVVRPTLREEGRRRAETYALRFLEEHPGEPVVVAVVGELDEAAVLRQQLAALEDARVPFLAHDR